MQMLIFKVNILCCVPYAHSIRSNLSIFHFKSIDDYINHVWARRFCVVVFFFFLLSSFSTKTYVIILENKYFYVFYFSHVTCGTFSVLPLTNWFTFYLHKLLFFPVFPIKPIWFMMCTRALFFWVAVRILISRFFVMLIWKNQSMLHEI